MNALFTPRKLQNDLLNGNFHLNFSSFESFSKGQNGIARTTQSVEVMDWDNKNWIAERSFPSFVTGTKTTSPYRNTSGLLAI